LTTSPDLASMVLIIVPLIIGLLVGFIVKHTVKLVFAIAVLAMFLVFTGFISITYQEIFTQVLMLMPKIIAIVSGVIEMLPFSSVTFIIGLAVGLWTG